ncbi:hypothetical protein A2961_00870 [Candidatus Woesebacteria bacterium RIFCSPLOWO2_01_FULL_39_21]|uniref:Uncharacterized protein n=1 Tax=Candidatus Woesebacteria bacterium RIFCSPLOWO2_01_FULL_39_21 TaxID=1802519 RepID=A0A1F8BMJ6_9BACT|nr:MAG: hypothetical protein A2961_00870 [Candidatus Woesebacteria bacterium RIFCSPLOWO2_01_FULL_39_21]
MVGLSNGEPHHEGNREYVDDLLGDEERGKTLVDDVRRAVFNEYDRALLEGTATTGQVELQKKHVETVAELVNEIVGILKSGEGTKISGPQEPIDVSLSVQRTAEIEAWAHDAGKIVPERQDPVEGGVNPTRTRLLVHGEDSALWTQQILESLKFSPKVVSRVTADIISHMPMPYLEKALLDAQIAQWIGKEVVLPKYLKKDKYPQPRSIEGAILFASDLLSSMVLAGKDIDEDPKAGCFDRYIVESLRTLNAKGAEKGMKGAFFSALGSLRTNIDRLIEPPEEKGRGGASEVEKRIGRVLGQKALDKVFKFWNFVEEIGFELDGKVVKDLDDLTVWEYQPQPGVGGAPDLVVDIDKTMKNYYEAVKAYRERYNLDPNKLAER